MMKKIMDNKNKVIIGCIVIIIVVATVLFFTFKTDDEGYTSSVTDGSNVVVKTGDISITKDDVYHYFLEYYGSSQVLDSALSYVADKEITDTTAINAKVEETKTSYQNYAENGDLDTYAVNNGYADLAEMTEKMLIPDAKQQLLQTKYIDSQFKNLSKEYKVKYLKVITVDTESQALKIISGSKDEASFTTLFNENSGSDEGLVTTENTSVDSKIIAKLDKFSKDGVYSKAIKTSESKYAVVWVYNTDTSAVKDEIKEAFANISDISTKMQTYYLSKYNFDVYEPQIKSAIKEMSKNYFK